MKKKIAENLKAARVGAGYRSARSFADRHNIKYITYSQYEQGTRSISVEILEGYAKILGKPMSYFFSNLTSQYSDYHILTAVGVYVDDHEPDIDKATYLRKVLNIFNNAKSLIDQSNISYEEALEQLCPKITEAWALIYQASFPDTHSW
ncbi:helix-turn-helix domain-containing protein [Piscirickettsia salmonis]|uniref:helix-turn-helix domain-containing protein n=1 Tax=Piscirickettsia salmonis TaxID=1238 RepID=UPI0006BC716D|nr:helix-turn-helix transcriptional regulator [Piscirickettsia salmonis]ALA26717.1 repressor [Piscirickettsia salmonis]APS45840.1 hypothetical protein AVI48_15520 [Piscirickettsia salmonis]APS49277.1 hypothetical protein AVI49_16605 [Piscirickettsia salmonis]QGO82334.1 Helix-turn-helix protein [Piscirickettsia salmonis]QGP24163.1 Helix-turn-helix protein [Piscirickettsia salmonis]